MTNLVRTHEDVQRLITEWINDRWFVWTDEEFMRIRSQRKQATFFIRHSNMKPEDAYYAFEQVKASMS